MPTQLTQINRNITYTYENAHGEVDGRTSEKHTLETSPTTFPFGTGAGQALHVHRAIYSLTTTPTEIAPYDFVSIWSQATQIDAVTALGFRNDSAVGMTVSIPAYNVGGYISPLLSDDSDAGPVLTIPAMGSWVWTAGPSPAYISGGSDPVFSVATVSGTGDMTVFMLGH